MKTGNMIPLRYSESLTMTCHAMLVESIFTHGLDLKSKRLKTQDRAITLIAFELGTGCHDILPSAMLDLFVILCNR